MDLKSQINWTILILLIQSFSGRSLMQPQSYQAVEMGLKLMTSLPESNFSNVVVLMSDDVSVGDNDDAWVDKEQILKLNNQTGVKISVVSVGFDNLESTNRIQIALRRRYDASQSTLFIVAVDVTSALLNILSTLDFKRNSWLFIFRFR